MPLIGLRKGLEGNHCGACGKGSYTRAQRVLGYFSRRLYDDVIGEVTTPILWPQLDKLNNKSQYSEDARAKTARFQRIWSCQTIWPLDFELCDIIGLCIIFLKEEIFWHRCKLSLNIFLLILLYKILAECSIQQNVQLAFRKLPLSIWMRTEGTIFKTISIW